MKPPDTSDWLVMIAVASMAALVGGLNRYQSSRREKGWPLIIVVKALTVFFVTTVTFLVLHSMFPLGLLILSQFWPGINGFEMPNSGIAGLSAIVGHFGLEKTVATMTKILERH